MQTTVNLETEKQNEPASRTNPLPIKRAVNQRLANNSLPSGSLHSVRKARRGSCTQNSSLSLLPVHTAFHHLQLFVYFSSNSTICFYFYSSANIPRWSLYIFMGRRSIYHQQTMIIEQRESVQMLSCTFQILDDTKVFIVSRKSWRTKTSNKVRIRSTSTRHFYAPAKMCYSDPINVFRPRLVLVAISEPVSGTCVHQLYKEMSFFTWHTPLFLLGNNRKW